MAKKVKAPPFVMIRRDLLKDKEWQKLSSGAKVVYVYLRAKFNYKTFNEVTLTYSEMKDVMSSASLSRALKELTDNQWIEKIKHGGLFGGCCTYKFNGKYRDFYYKGRAV